MSDGQAVLLAVFLLAANAFFVGAEFALISARRTQIEPRAQGGSRAARVTLRAMGDISTMMAGAQLGITICSLGLGAIGEPAVAHLLEPGLERAGISEHLLHPIAFTIALAIVVALHVVLGEMVPKNIAIAGPDRAALVLGPPLVAVVAALKPLVITLNAIANGLLRLVRVSLADEVRSAFTREEVAALVEQSHREGMLDMDSYELIAGALEFEQRSIARIAIPLHHFNTVPHTATPGDVEQRCAQTGFSRFGVTEAGQLIGYVHVKDVLVEDTARDAALPREAIRPLVRVPHNAALPEVLTLMQDQGAHLAAAAGPHDELTGVVLLGDVLAELVGEIRDAARGTPRG